MVTHRNGYSSVTKREEVFVELYTDMVSKFLYKITGNCGVSDEDVSSGVNRCQSENPKVNDRQLTSGLYNLIF